MSRGCLTGVLMLLLFASVITQGRAQTHEGTIESSWEARSGTREYVTQPPPPVRSAPERPDTYTTWNRVRSMESRPWPQLPKNPTGSDYYQANSALIDSLANLYCLSSNYVRTLRNRNESLERPLPPLRRDFSYTESEHRQVRSGYARQSYESLYKELLLLLDQCLYGK